MDTIFNVDSRKCKKCYTCVQTCSFLHKDKGFLGYLTCSPYGVKFNGETYGCNCHRCEAKILRENDKISGVALVESEDGDIVKGFICNKVCPHGAMNIERW